MAAVKQNSAGRYYSTNGDPKNEGSPGTGAKNTPVQENPIGWKEHPPSPFTPAAKKSPKHQAPTPHPLFRPTKEDGNWPDGFRIQYLDKPGIVLVW